MLPLIHVWRGISVGNMTVLASVQDSDGRENGPLAMVARKGWVASSCFHFRVPRRETGEEGWRLVAPQPNSTAGRQE